MVDVALVIGASGDLGKAFCEALRGENRQVIVAGRNMDEMQALVASGAAAQSIHCDLTDPAAVEDMASRAGNAELVIIASGYASPGAFAAQPWQSRRDEIMVNCVSVAHIAHVFGQRMLATGHGRIILIGSTAAARPAPGLAAYAASKAFVCALAESLAAEWAPRGVHVTCCIAGPMGTGFVRRAGLAPARRTRDPAKVAARALAASGSGASGRVFSDQSAHWRTRMFQLAPRALLAWLAAERSR